MVDVVEVVLNGQTVLYAEHDGLASVALVGIQVVGCAGYRYVVGVACRDVFYLVEDEVGVSLGAFGAELRHLGKALTLAGLRKISHHGHCVLASVVHLVQIYEYARVAFLEAYALREEHRSVAMGVEGERGGVSAFCLAEQSRFVYEPFEQRQTLFAQPFGMPLHTDHRLVLGALHGFGRAVGRCRYDAHAFAWRRYCLMVEGVDKQRVDAEYAVKE